MSKSVHEEAMFVCLISSQLVATEPASNLEMWLVSCRHLVDFLHMYA